MIFFKTAVDSMGIQKSEYENNINVQDNCTVHTETDSPAVIGDSVTLDRNAVVHGWIVEMAVVPLLLN
jgi:carbonic anhydrase/acetyltransferase-like protein (isoleucine patch superfamily)